MWETLVLSDGTLHTVKATTRGVSKKEAVGLARKLKKEGAPAKVGKPKQTNGNRSTDGPPRTKRRSPRR
jgi:hypothetical protein